METLHSLATRAIRAIISLQAAVADYEDNENQFRMSNHSSDTEWKKRDSSTNSESSDDVNIKPKKSSLKSMNHQVDKKVRFNITLNTVINESMEENETWDSIDTIDV